MIRLLPAAVLLLCAPLCALAPSSAHAGESDDAPEFLLGDLGVRIDLSSRWRMLRWSDWDFKAETADRSVYMMAWGTVVQSEPIAAELDLWTATYEAHASDVGAQTLERVGARIGDRGDAPNAALLDFRFEAPQGNAVLYGASIPIAGGSFHMAFISRDSLASRAEAARDEVLERLDVQSPPGPVEWGPTVQAPGLSSTLPDDWRLPLDTEKMLALRGVATLGVDSIVPCWLALRPRGTQDPEILLTCQGGLWVGHVDETTFADKEAELRPRLFGEAPVPPAARIQLGDRTGMLYAPELASNALRLAVVPYDRGLARTWALGTSERGASLEQAVNAVAQSTDYGGAHPVGLGERAAYWLTYRLTSPQTLGALGGVGLLLAGLATLLLRTRRQAAWDDDDL